MAYLRTSSGIPIPGGVNVRENERNEARFNFRVQPNLDKIKPRTWVMSCLQHDLPTRHRRTIWHNPHKKELPDTPMHLSVRQLSYD